MMGLASLLKYCPPILWACGMADGAFSKGLEITLGAVSECSGRAPKVVLCMPQLFELYAVLKTIYLLDSIKLPRSWQFI